MADIILALVIHDVLVVCAVALWLFWRAATWASR